MRPRLLSAIGIIVLICLAGCSTDLPDDVALAYEQLPEEIDFNQHIRPLLSDRCYACHGPDDKAREAGLRLDLKEHAFARLEDSNGRALKKRSPARSVAWQRIVSDDPDFQMPPPESNLSLTPLEKARFTKWIEQGAVWEDHWAFTPPENPNLPSASLGEEAHPIDQFVQAKREEKGLSPSPQAGRERLIRRVTLDLTGLPPTIDAIDAFLADTSPSAYETLVDGLQNTDAYAERMAMEWLDVARYADTNGMHSDLFRYNWPWRDWVINAFKENMPYDQFITWQLAGDLLPNATHEQRLATAFLRHHPTSAEGGIVNEEYRQKYVQDRANTTATAFMGLTMECAACHDHKFDPISQEEYYGMTAFFNNIRELGMHAEFGSYESTIATGPSMLMPDSAVAPQLDSLASRIAEVREELVKLEDDFVLSLEELITLKESDIVVPEPIGFYPFETIEPREMDLDNVHRILANSVVDKVVDGNADTPASGELQVVEGRIGHALKFVKERELVFLKDVGHLELNEPFSAGAWINTERDSVNQTIIGNSGELGTAWRGWDFFLNEDNKPVLRLTSFYPHNYLEVTGEIAISPNEWRHLFFTYDGSGKAAGVQLYVDGKAINQHVSYDYLYKSMREKNFGKRKGWDVKPIMVGRSGRFFTGDNGVFEGIIDHVKVFHEVLSEVEVAALLHKDDPSLVDPSALPDHAFTNHALQSSANYTALQEELQQLLGEQISLMEGVPEIMVMVEMQEPRPTYVLDRGQYDRPLQQVQPATPAAIQDFPEDLPRNRLGLAQWLIDEKHPLTARVTVNRYWQMIFGRGIVNTPQDFGAQGELPSHPALLDWLALDFIAHGWDVKRLIKQMVMSDTYRQVSRATDAHMEIDPENVYLARGPQYRLPAEMIRDNALAASGLLAAHVGGESVKPYQPEGIWSDKTGPWKKYEPNSGDSLYRRSMYTFIRRTSPHPAMITFDAPNRSVCIVKRENTNTPLQALVLLNDPQFVEAARVLAQRMQTEGGDSLAEQTTFAFRLITGRRPTDTELGIFTAQYDEALAKYREEPQQANELLAVGEYPFDASLDRVETAALTIVANTMLNHDEAYMKR